MAWFVCKCGLRFSTRPQLGNHIEIGNDRWPQPKVEEHDEAENWESIKDDDSVRKDKA